MTLCMAKHVQHCAYMACFVEGQNRHAELAEAFGIFLKIMVRMVCVMVVEALPEASR